MRRWGMLALLVLLGAALAPAAAQAFPGVSLAWTVERDTCAGRFVPEPQQLARVGAGDREQWVDPGATYWDLTRPVVYARAGGQLRAQERHRLGDGAIVVTSELDPGSHRFRWTLQPEPAGDFALALEQYLPGLRLPCAVEGALAVREAPAVDLDPGATIRVYRLLHEASEKLYEPDFAGARARLAEAAALAPDSATVRWLEARERFLEAESLPDSERDARLAGFRAAEQAADRAVALDPGSAEAHLWRAVARGRLATSEGNLRAVLAGWSGGRGPAWLAREFEEAVRLGARYREFGFTAHGDALYGAAQLYRLLPEARLVGALLGVRGDLDRAVELARAALAIQPNRIEYAKELGVALLCRGARRHRAEDVREGRRVLESALRMPVRTPLEHVDHAHVGALLREPPARACAYSRDGWQDGSGIVEAAR